MWHVPFHPLDMERDATEAEVVDSGRVEVKDRLHHIMEEAEEEGIITVVECEVNDYARKSRILYVISIHKKHF